MNKYRISRYNNGYEDQYRVEVFIPGKAKPLWCTEDKWKTAVIKQDSFAGTLVSDCIYHTIEDARQAMQELVESDQIKQRGKFQFIEVVGNS